uniref:Uncharacterized protein n=1 Tax=Myoviridae sp. cti9m5 TaxID=2827613 RepID=A0A8S5LPF5_9CAUD|nr:MAG TPA: hypothetical protein [Myoviridae sp. cti9m5]DAM33370.1 MAG TPA: hypothetical protein [Caudoviricetes sp.]
MVRQPERFIGAVNNQHFGGFCTLKRHLLRRKC